MNDKLLVERVAQGDADAIGKLLDRYYSSIERYLFHACGSREDSEDLACQTFLKIRRDIHQIKNAQLLKAWIYRVAHREFLMWRRRSVLTLKVFEPHPTAHASLDEIVLAEALSKLSTPNREAFLLVVVEGLSVEEAATALGVPQGTIKSRCHSARLRLRALLALTFSEVSQNAKPITD